MRVYSGLAVHVIPSCSLGMRDIFDSKDASDIRRHSFLHDPATCHPRQALKARVEGLKVVSVV